MEKEFEIRIYRCQIFNSYYFLYYLLLKEHDASWFLSAPVESRAMETISVRHHWSQVTPTEVGLHY